MKIQEKSTILPDTFRGPRRLFHMTAASACVVLLATLAMLLPVLRELIREWFK